MCVGADTYIITYCNAVPTGCVEEREITCYTYRVIDIGRKVADVQRFPTPTSVLIISGGGSIYLVGFQLFPSSSLLKAIFWFLCLVFVTAFHVYGCKSSITLFMYHYHVISD